MHVAFREFKDRLSELLRRAEAGEEMVVTSRGRRVARLGPIDQAHPCDPLEALNRGLGTRRGGPPHRLRADA